MLGRLRRTYFGNAVSVRDFRVGLRGNRSALLLGLYLFLLIGVSLLVYDSSTSNVTLSQAQENLRGFYAAIMGMVAFSACAIATATGATAIVMEVQRRQLELVTMTSAPPRYLLVGKLVSSFRYTWMVLILSLPVTASCVVLGGATWTSVVLSYVLISFFALLCAAIGLAVSTHADKPTGAVARAFAGVIFYLIVSAALFASGTFTSGASAFRGGSGASAPFVTLLNPAAVLYAPLLDTTSTIWGRTIPNIVLACGAILLLVRYLLHVGGLAISHRDSRTIAYFRLDTLISLALLCLGGGWLAAQLYGSVGFRTFGASSAPTVPVGTAWGWLLVVILMAAIPAVTAYGFDGLKRSRPDAAFRLRETLSGRPSGALPFAFLMVLSSAGAYALGFQFAGVPIGWGFLGTVGFLLAYACFVWALTRSAASSLVGAKQASTVGVAFTLLLVFGVLAFLATATYGAWYSPGEQWWMLYPLRPILGRREDWTNLTHGTFLLVLAVFLFWRGERRLARNLAKPPVAKPTLPPILHA